jgi:hypothetical protein
MSPAVTRIPARLTIVALLLSCAHTAQAIDTVQPNDNCRNAGRLAGNTLQLDLEAREGLWYPETKDGAGFAVQAFAEAG